ncbi:MULTISPECIES: hypothetical protein [Mesorhizobium]|nr:MULTISPECIES: hypothetical protein [Mesorhizobium]
MGHDPTNPTKQRMAVAAMLKTIFAQETKADAETQWRLWHADSDD